MNVCVTLANFTGFRRPASINPSGVRYKSLLQTQNTAKPPAEQVVRQQYTRYLASLIQQWSAKQDEAKAAKIAGIGK